MELPQLSKVSSAQNLRRNEQAGTPQKEISRRQIDSLTKSDALNELNNCAFYNQKQDHRQALKHAEAAIQILETELQIIRAKIEVAPQSLSDSEKQHFLERTSLLSIAYYNKGCECEHLKKIIKATQAYSRAVNLQSSRHGNQVLLKQFKLSLKQARFKLRQQMMPQTTTASKRASVSKSPIHKRARPSSARLDFNFAQQQQQYGKNITDITGVDRPQSALHNHEVIENEKIKQFKHGVQNQSAVKQSQNFLMDSSGSGFDKVQDFDPESLRKTVISEYDAADNLSEYTQTQQQVLGRMIARPPKNNQDSQQRLRGIRQASQRPQQAAEQVRQKHGRNVSQTQQTNPNPPLQQTLFQVVDEVLSSMEAGPGKFQNNSHKHNNQSRSPEQFNINSIHGSSHSNKSKKLLELGGRFSFGSQNLFKATTPLLLSENQKIKKQSPKSSTKDQTKLSASTKNMIDKIKATQKQFQTPVLQQHHSPKRKQQSVAQKLLISSLAKITNNSLQAQPKSKQDPQRIGQVQIFSQTQKFSKDESSENLTVILEQNRQRNIRRAIIEAEKDKLAGKVVCRDFKVFFNSNKNKPNFIKACRMIQKLVKRHKFRKIVNNTIAIHRAEREKKLKAVLMIQKLFRRRKMRKVVKLALAAARIQKNPDFFKILLRMQRIFRRNKLVKIAKQLLAKKKAQRELLKLRTIIKIQSLFRRKKAKLEAVKRRFAQNFKLFSVIIKLQWLFRKRRAKRLQQQAQLRKVNSENKRKKFISITLTDIYLKRIQDSPRRLDVIIRLQSQFRIMKAKRIVQRLLMKNRMEKDPQFRKAVIMIQSWIRRRKARRLVYAALVQKRMKGLPKFEKAATKIQCLFRRLKARSLVFQVMMLKKMQDPKYAKAVLLIQSLFRRRKARKLVQLAFALHRIQKDPKKLAMVIKVQSVFRRHKVIKIVRLALALHKIEQDPKKIQMVVKVQSLFRRRKMMRIVKLALAKRRIEQNATLLKHLIKIQSLWRRRKMMRVVRLALALERIKKDPKKIAMVIKVQSVFRRWKMRRIVRLALALRRIEQDPKKMKMVIKVQSLFRRRKIMKIVRLALALRRIEQDATLLQNVVKIQSLWRRRKIMKLVRLVLVLHRIEQDPKKLAMVIKVQSVFRRWKMKRIVRLALAKRRIEQNSTLLKHLVKVQSLWRRRKIMRAVRLTLALERIKKDPKKLAMVIKVQSVFRRWKMRRIVRLALAKRRIEQDQTLLKYLVKIQSLWRRRKIMRTVKLAIALERIKKDGKKLAMVIKVQSVFRRWKMRRIVKLALAKRRIEQDLTLLKHLVKIQSLWRRRKIMRTVKLAMALERIKKDPKKLAMVIKVQSVFRRWKMKRIVKLALVKRRIEQDATLLKHLVKIQSLWRRRKIMRTVKLAMALERIKKDPKKLAMVIKVQSVFRRWKMKRIVKLALVKRRFEQDATLLKNLVRIQSLWRRRKIMRAVKLALALERIKKDPKKLAMVIKVQSLFRRWKTRRIVRLALAKRRIEQDANLLKHLVRIQSLWRRRKIMRAVKLAMALERIKKDPIKLSLLMKVQSLFRRRKMIKIIKQTQWLHRISKDPKKVKMVVKIQSLFRRRKIMKVIKQALWLHRISKDPKKVKMVIKVQSLFRRRKIMRVVRLALLKRRIEQDQHLMDNILVIQRLWRKKKFLRVVKLALAKRRIEQDAEKMENLRKIQALFRKRKARKVVTAAVAQNANKKTESKATVELKKQAQISSDHKKYKQDPKYEQAAKKIQSMFRRRKLILAVTKSLQIKQASKKKAQTSLKNVIHKQKIKSIAVAAFKDTKSSISTLHSAALPPKTKITLAQQVKTLGKKIITDNRSQQQQVLKAVRLIQSWYRRRKLRLAFLRAMPIFVKTIKQQGCFFKVVVAMNNQSSLLLKVISLPGNRQSQELIVNLPTNQNISFSKVDFAQQIIKKLSINTLGKARILTDEEILSFGKTRNQTTFQETNEKAHATFGKNTKTKLSTLQVKNFVSSSITELPIPRDQISQKSSLSHKRAETALASQPQKIVSGFSYNSIQSEKFQVSRPNLTQKSSQKVSVISSKNLSESPSQQLLAQQLNKIPVTGHVSVKPTQKLIESITPDSKQELLKQQSQQLSETSMNNSTHKQQKKEPHTLTSNPNTYRIQLEPDGMKNIKVHFQPAIVKKKSFVLVTLLKNQEAIDRKILPVDIYSGAMAVGLFDLDQFCKEQIMPCLQIKERKLGSQFIEVNETKLTALLKQCDLEQEVPQKNAVQQAPIQTSKKISERTLNSESSKKSTTIKAQSFQKKLSGLLPLIKRSQTIDYLDYNLQVNFDFDTHTMQFTVEKMNEKFTLNLVISAATPRELGDLHEKAEEICKQLVVTDNGLQIRKASKSQLKDDQVVFRTGKSIQGSFYVVSLGFMNSQLIVDAYDKINEKRLLLRLEWNSKTELLQKDACKLIDKLDVMELAGNLMLVIR